MLAQTLKSKRLAPVTVSATAALLRGLVLSGLMFPAGLTVAQESSLPPAVAGPAAAASVVVSYVSEVPWPSYAGMANPLERWARQLSSSWAAPATESAARLNNLHPELSFRQLLKTAANPLRRKADVYLVHGYELLEQGESPPLEAFLTPSSNGRASMAEFVILRKRMAPGPGSDTRFSLRDLAQKIILVDRGGCGELVYRWLEVEIVPLSGHSKRENFAEFRTAANATEAVLSVYFGEADACVVTAEDYFSVLRTNPSGLQAKVEEICRSPRLLRHVVACRSDMEPGMRQQLEKAASAVRMPLNGIVWSLTKPHHEDLDSLRQLLERWRSFFPSPGSGVHPAAPPAGDSPGSGSGPDLSARESNERRVP